ncbi:MAG: hypothetical protein ACRDOK_25560 [Streptosporangiaceae bacterium]
MEVRASPEQAKRQQRRLGPGLEDQETSEEGRGRRSSARVRVAVQQTVGACEIA